MAHPNVPYRSAFFSPSYRLERVLVGLQDEEKEKQEKQNLLNRLLELGVLINQAPPSPAAVDGCKFHTSEQ